MSVTISVFEEEKHFNKNYNSFHFMAKVNVHNRNLWEPFSFIFHETIGATMKISQQLKQSENRWKISMLKYEDC